MKPSIPAALRAHPSFRDTRSEGDTQLILHVRVQDFVTLDLYFHELWDDLHAEAQKRLEGQARDNAKRARMEAQDQRSAALPAQLAPVHPHRARGLRPSQAQRYNPYGREPDPPQQAPRVCPHWLNGYCNRGDRCRWVHSTQPHLALPAPDRQEAPRAPLRQP